VSFFSALVFGQKLDLACSSALKGRTYSFFRPIQSVREAFPAWLSRYRQAYKERWFDIYILSEDLNKNSFSPLKLKKTTAGKIKKFHKAYEALGFFPSEFIHALVEAHPHAMRVFQTTDPVGWVKSKDTVPFVTSFFKGYCIAIPTHSGGWLRFGHPYYGSSGQNDKILAVRALSETYHTLENDFVLAHELAHTTEKEAAFFSLTWIEARADFLAYAITGETEVVFPEGLAIEEITPTGDFSQNVLFTVRSLTNPTVPDVDSLSFEYHKNSQVISSALYEIANKIGMNAVISLILWMDSQDMSGEIMHVCASTDLAANRRCILEMFHKIGMFLRKGLEAVSLTPPQKREILSILEKKGI